MTTMFVVTGMLAWLAMALGFALVVVLVAVKRGPLMRRLQQPDLAPYTWWASYRIKGVLMAAMRRLGGARRLPNEVVEAHREVQLASMKKLRDVYTEIDRLPTIEKGKAAVGMKSVFEFAYKPVRHVKSPYTHPLQYPPYYLPGVA